VAEALRSPGHDVAVPYLRKAAARGEPRAVVHAALQLRAKEPTVLLGHCGAEPFLRGCRDIRRRRCGQGSGAASLGLASIGVGSRHTIAGPGGLERMSVYKVIEIIGTSTTSWEDAASSAVVKARETLRDLRVAEVVKQDLDIGADGSVTYRTKLSVSFKYEDS
jgi:flavin-binding protein dodecin